MKQGKSEGSQAFNVPTTDEGKAFIKLLRKFANKPDCQISVRGRGKRAVNGQSARRYASYVPVGFSEWLAVYVRSEKTFKGHMKNFCKVMAEMREKDKRITELEAQVNGNDPTKTNTLQDRNNQQAETIKTLQSRNLSLETQAYVLQDQVKGLREAYSDFKRQGYQAYFDLKKEKQQPVLFDHQANPPAIPANPPFGTVTISIKGAHIRVVQE